VRTKPVLLLALIFILAACSPKPTPTAELPTPSATPAASPTNANPLVILVLPADLPQSMQDKYQTLVYDLAQQNALRFQVRNTLSMEDVQAELPSLKIVVALPPDPGLAALAASAPTVQFLAVDVPGVSSLPNLSIIGGADQPVDKQAFLAGYLAAMLAPEWRVGILSERDTPGGESARTAFANGFHFYCGYCRNQNFTQPYYEYPIVVRIPTDASQNEYTGYAAALLDYYCKVVYVYPSVATDEVLSYMADYGVMLVGQELPGEDLRSNWIASIQPDVIPAIQNIFPSLLEGNGGQTVPTPLYLTDVNGNLLTEGKLRLAQEVLDGLQNGTIGTGVTP
jgi:hypothetical protein